MTAPFNPTALARKAAQRIREPRTVEVPHFDSTAAEEAWRNERLAGELMAFARDVIRQSGAVEALGTAEGDIQFWIEHNRESERPMTEMGQRMLKTRTKLQNASLRLRSITTAPGSDMASTPGGPS
jgi:hypothetical protein